ncbi:TolC family protein [Dysgonomonas sp. HGC4]|uniref:TolC family protein n=1 Tax=Dysgonomonas sp. HGC4 TaxID=1658009 RepID=UPI0006820133|nr:TolC family protein [Dysgonomonas sp. HGC4]MBD8349639.1 TolC family protein [Dysgonomonas sp. HGC4]
MKKYLLLLLSIFSLTNIKAQELQVLQLSAEQVEALFLKQNLQLIAEHLNIDIADAAIVQAKLWDNPEISVGQINLWSTDRQREGEKEAIPPLFGSFARNTQFSIELSQLIQTAGKRGKLVKQEKISKEIAIQEFEEVFRGLKVELRKSINEIVYLQAYQKVLAQQEESLGQLTIAYQKQVAQGNIAKSELLRLQSALLELENEANDTQIDINEQQKGLKTLLNVPPSVVIKIIDNTKKVQDPTNLSLAELLAMASEYRPDVKASRLQTQYHEKSLAYEKAQRIPDLTVNANYDRYGGVWKDFIGFGVSFDIPFFNRNQGNIKAARINRDQSIHLAELQQNQAQHEVAEAFGNYALAYRFYKRVSENSLLSELDGMLTIYTKNLLNKNISMLEYIDFMDSYKTNKETLLSARKKVDTQFEELQYTVGSEIK